MTFEVLTTTDECPEGYYAVIVDLHEMEYPCEGCHFEPDNLSVIFKPIESKDQQ